VVAVFILFLRPNFNNNYININDKDNSNNSVNTNANKWILTNKSTGSSGKMYHTTSGEIDEPVFG
jgi:hypothetical protein